MGPIINVGKLIYQSHKTLVMPNVTNTKKQQDMFNFNNSSFFPMLFQYLAVPIVNATILAEQVLNEPS